MQSFVQFIHELRRRGVADFPQSATPRRRSSWMNCTKDCMKERIRQVHYVPPSSGWFILLATTAGRFIGRHSNSMPDPELSPRRLPSCERFAPLIAMLHETVFG